MVLGVSRVELFLDSQGDGALIDIQKAEGAKCARCWIYKTDVGVQNEYPDLCGRCADAVKEMKVCEA